jgi:hypothetical protein
MSLTPIPGDHFHVPGDTALVHVIAELLISGDGEWVVRATDGSHWVVTHDDSLADVGFIGRPAGPRRHV